MNEMSKILYYVVLYFLEIWSQSLNNYDLNVFSCCLENTLEDFWYNVLNIFSPLVVVLHILTILLLLNIIDISKCGQNVKV